MDGEFWQNFGRLFRSALVPINVAANVLSVWTWCSQGSLWSVPMVGLLGLSNLAVAAASIVSYNAPQTPKRWILKALLLSPFMPVMHCLQTERRSNFWAMFTTTTGGESRGVSEALARARLEVEWCAPRMSTVGVDNLMLIVHTVFALPLALVQLLAMSTCGEEPTVTQVLAIGTSFATLTVTGILFCRAFSLRVVAFQVACVVFDVASIFYTYATLFAVQTEYDTTWLGVGVSWQGRLLLWKVLGLYGIAFTVLSGSLAWDWVFSSRARGVKLRTMVWYSFLYGVLLLGPLALVVEAIRLSWVIPALALVEPREKALIALLVSFCQDANADLRSRFVATRLLHASSVTAAKTAMEAAARRKAPFTLESAMLKAFGSSVNDRINDALIDRGVHVQGSRIVRTCFHLMHISQLASIAYVIVTGTRQHATHTCVQAALFYASCASLLTAVCLSREVWIYVRRCAAFALVPPPYRAVAFVKDWFSFITPRIEAALVKRGVAVSTLPTEVTQLVAEYFSDGDMVESAMLNIRNLERLVDDDDDNDDVSKPQRVRRRGKKLKQRTQEEHP